MAAAQSRDSGSKSSKGSGSKSSDKKKSNSSKAPAKQEEDSKGQGSPSQPHAAATSNWALVVGTFTEGDHEQAARTMLEELRTVSPQVASGCRVHIGSKGSMVIFGQYPSRDDAQAKQDQERLKKITFQNRPLFNRVILTRIDARTMNSTFHPNDLLTVRQKFPKVDPLYTVDIAIWSDFGENKSKLEDLQKKAEAYCQQLRAQNIEAYFYHDPANQLSLVTVGVFDRRAIDPKSHLFSADVQSVMKKFPQRLVNGEPMMEFKDPYHPKDGLKPQEPKLVLVPEL